MPMSETYAGHPTYGATKAAIDGQRTLAKLRADRLRNAMKPSGPRYRPVFSWPACSKCCQSMTGVYAGHVRCVRCA